jgi:hypothetical protein
MRRVLSLLLLLCLFAAPALANQKLQGWTESGGVSVVISGTPGSAAQRFQQSFRGATITVYAAGTVTLSTIYSDNLATPTAQANPFTANSMTGAWSFFAASGRYDVRFSGGGISTPFTLGDFLLFDPADPINIGNRIYCSQYTGANFGAKFTAAAALLPSTGGIVDCSNLQGAQTIASDVFTGQTKPLTVIWPTGTASSSVSLTVPSTMTIDFPEGGILSMAAATTATVNGEVKGTMSRHFAGSGNFTFPTSLSKTPFLYTEWWGATGDNVTDDTAAIQGALNSASYGVPVQLLAATYRFTTLCLRTATSLIGAGIRTSTLIRSGVGTGGPALDMCAGHAAVAMHLTDFSLNANSIGVLLNGIELGTETPGVTDLAIGSSLENVFVENATGTAWVLYVNVAEGRNLWSWRSRIGFDIRGTVFYGYDINPEYSTLQDLILTAKASAIFGLQTEGDSTPDATVDVISVNGPDSSLYGVWSNHTIARRGVVGITGLGTNTTIVSVHNEGVGPTNTITDDSGNGGLTLTNDDIQFYSNGARSAQRELTLFGQNSGNINTLLTLQNLGTAAHTGARIILSEGVATGTASNGSDILWTAAGGATIGQVVANHNGSGGSTMVMGTRTNAGSYTDKLTISSEGIISGTTVTVGVTSTVTITTANLQFRGNDVLKDGLPACSGGGCVMGATSTNTSMNMTTTTTGAVDITVTFSNAFDNAPSCFANNDTTGNLLRVTTVVTTSIHVQGVTVNGDTLRVGCFGN